VKSRTLRFLLACLLFLGSAAICETVTHSIYIEGQVIGAQRFWKNFKYTTKIRFQEDAQAPDAETRRFCGNWEEQVNKLRGKRIRLNLVYKEYAHDECSKISSIEVLN